MAVATLNGSSVWLVISRGCPQRGVLLTLLWCLVVNDLLARLSGSGTFIQGYADDMSSCGGYIPKHGFRTHAVHPLNHRDGDHHSMVVWLSNG